MVLAPALAVLWLSHCSPLSLSGIEGQPSVLKALDRNHEEHLIHRLCITPKRLYRSFLLRGHLALQNLLTVWYSPDHIVIPISTYKT